MVNSTCLSVQFKLNELNAQHQPVIVNELHFQIYVVFSSLYSVYNYVKL